MEIPESPQDDFPKFGRILSPAIDFEFLHVFVKVEIAGFYFRIGNDVLNPFFYGIPFHLAAHIRQIEEGLPVCIFAHISAPGQLDRGDVALPIYTVVCKVPGQGV